MNSFAQDQRRFSSGTWDPSQHRRISFPILEHPNARPEQAPGEGVRELLYQYEALQAPSTEPLNIFWNDEEEDTNGLNRRLEEEEEAELQRVRERLTMDIPVDRQGRRARALCTGTLVVALLLFLTSVTVLIVGTVCVFGQCGGGEEKEPTNVVDYPWPTGTVVYTRYPSAAPTLMQSNDALGGSSSVGTSDTTPTNNNEATPEAESNIFARPTSAPPTLMPTQQPTLDPYLTNQTYAPDEATLVPTVTDAVDVENGNNATLPSISNATDGNSTTIADAYNTTIPILNGTEVLETASNATFSNFTTSNATTLDTNELIIVANQSSTNVLVAMELITVMKTKSDTVADGALP